MQINMEIVPEVFIANRYSAYQVLQMSKAGVIRKIGPKLYTRNLSDSPETIVRRNLWPIVALIAPGTVVSYRTAFENNPAPDGSIFLTGQYPRTVSLPGVTLRQLAGSGPVEGDTIYMGTLYLASRARAFLENLTPSRTKGLVSKAVGKTSIEERLARVLQLQGEEHLNGLRDKAKSIAPSLKLDGEYLRLTKLVSALLRTHQTHLESSVARAYASGEPYDSNRLEVFDKLLASLRNEDWAERPSRATTPITFHNLSFYDAYFSNYIEGTEFLVEEAIDIVFNNAIPTERPADAHDVLETYRILSSQEEMRNVPSGFDGFIAVLKSRHASVMEGRAEQQPGQFKLKANRAGSTYFVEPELVLGTLRQGFLRYQALDTSMARALFIMFLIAEVHPFADGNGRMARIMMNAELVTGGQTRIIIPSVYRSEYINGLKLLTHHKDPSAFIRVMSYAQQFTFSIDFSDLNDATQQLASLNAFHDPDDNVRLKMPSS